MKIKISTVKHKNMEALLLESNSLALTLIPQSGSKIQSIFDKVRQKELLYQSPRPQFRSTRYGEAFASGDMSGFDEIFPSIDECYYPTWPWTGTLVPDHGEVWALPWDYTIEENSVIFGVTGVRFPYRLEKKVEFLRDNCFRLSYKAINLSNFDFDFIWSPHPYFMCHENSMVVLPPSVKQVISTCSLPNKLGDYGSIHPWPVTAAPSGEAYDISDVLNPRYDGKCEKFYALNRPAEGWCALHNTRTGEFIGLSYPAEQLPYLGVWQGNLDGVYVTALEPVSGAFDRLDISKMWAKNGVIKAKSDYQWYLNLTVDQVEHFNGLDSEGRIY